MDLTCYFVRKIVKYVLKTIYKFAVKILYYLFIYYIFVSSGHRARDVSWHHTSDKHRAKPTTAPARPSNQGQAVT